MNTAWNLTGSAGWFALVAGFFYLLGQFQGQRSFDDEPIDFSDVAVPDLTEEVNQ